MTRRLIILGSTGSIGVQALDVVARSQGELEVVGLSADRGWERLLEQARQHGVRRVALADPDAAARAGESWTGETLAGPDGLVRLITEGALRPGPQRDRRLGRPGADGGRARRGD